MATRERDTGRFARERVRCGSCEMLSIQGVPCHESGCPDAWRGQPVPCWQCGCDYVPEYRPTRYSLCPDCRKGEES